MFWKSFESLLKEFINHLHLLDHLIRKMPRHNDYLNHLFPLYETFLSDTKCLKSFTAQGIMPPVLTLRCSGCIENSSSASVSNRNYDNKKIN